MTTIIMAMISGALIALGAASIWRDLARSRRAKGATSPAPVAATDPVRAMVVPVAGSTPARRALPSQTLLVSGQTPAATLTRLDTSPRETPPPPLAAGMAPVPYRAGPPPVGTLQDLTQTIGGIASELDDSGPEFARVPSVEAGWHVIAATVDAAVNRINAVLVPVHLGIGAAGEPGWSYKNRGFGVYRRIRLNEPSIAWMRIELTGDRKLSLKLRAHRQEQALMNDAVHVPADALTDIAVIDAVALCIKPAAQYAAWIAPRADADRDASAALWAEIDGAAQAALQMTNGALRQAGATLVPLARPAFEPATHRFRWPLSVNVDGTTVALMVLERQSEALEISVGVADVARLDLGRRHRLSVDGITPHALAEHMASSAWPSIADARAGVGAA